jgi:hypothetical protein
MKVLPNTLLNISATLALLSMLPAHCSAEPRIILRDEVTVTGSRISLVDLLPADSPARLQQIAAAVSFGGAPLSGSTRVVLQKEVQSRLTESGVPLEQFQIPPQIVLHRGGFSVSPENVRGSILRFLQEKGWPGTGLPDKFSAQLAAGTTAAEPDPELEVTGMDWDERAHRLQIRLRCRTRASCASFLVEAPVQGPMVHIWQERLRGQRRSLQGHAQSAPKNVVGPILVQAGKSAMLTMESAGMRIVLPVVCLQRGGLAQRINVRDPETRKILQAEVVGVGRLQTTF